MDSNENKIRKKRLDIALKLLNRTKKGEKVNIKKMAGGGTIIEKKINNSNSNKIVNISSEKNNKGTNDYTISFEIKPKKPPKKPPKKN